MVALKKTNVVGMEVSEIRLLWWMSGFQSPKQIRKMNIKGHKLSIVDTRGKTRMILTSVEKV